MDTKTTEITSAEQMDELTDFALVVGKPAEVNGVESTIALQKISGDWYAPGFPYPLRLTELNTDTFFPAKLVFTL